MFSKPRSENGPETAHGSSLAFRLTAWYSTISFLLIASATGLLYYGVATNLKRISEQLLVDEVAVCKALIMARASDMHALREEAEIDSAIRRYERFYLRVLDEHDRGLTTTPGMDKELSATMLDSESARYPNQIFWVQSSTGRPYRATVATVPLDWGGPHSSVRGEHAWTLQVAVDLTQELEVLSRHRIWVWTVLVAAAIFCPMVGYAIARHGTAPLREMAETARHVSSSTLSDRLHPQGYPGEVAALAETFNDMLQRLEESFARLSQFSADIAHELRTPVSSIRGEAEVALTRARSAEEYREALASCLEEAVRLSDLIDPLLFLARSESPGDHLRREVADVAELLAAVRDYYDAAASEAGVSLSVEGEHGVRADLDRTLFQRAIGNLVSNALAHTPAGGSVRLSVKPEGQKVLVKVSDTGCGIPAEMLPRLFDRFYRADPARGRRPLGGTGLGLAIVRRIVRLHGGDVKIESELGKGTDVTVELPGRSS